MPIYSFHCPRCRRHFDVITIKAEWDEIRCKCGKKPKKLLNAPCFVVKGANAQNSYGLKTEGTDGKGK